MSRSRISPIVALLLFALVAVPAALAKGRDHRAVRIQGACTQQSTSKLKLSREDRGIEVEFEVDQNQNGVPWTVTISRNGTAVKSFTAVTHAPSGSFEAERVIAGRLGVDRISVSATRASGETCSASGTGAKVSPAAADDDDDDAGDDHGGRSGGHS
jgi:hypothetical protein